MGTIPRVSIHAKPEHLGLAASFATRLLSADYDWPQSGLAEMRVEGEGPAFLLVGRKSRSGLSIVGRDP